MIKDVSITVTPEEERNPALLKKIICSTLTRNGTRVNPNEVTPVFVKKSIDARHSHIKLMLRYKVYIGEKPGDVSTSELCEWKHADGSRKIIIIGAGPAGLFGALKLLEQGVQPVIIERGSETSTRKRDIAAISTQGVVGENSNYCFGEGGAGTFSDGKLYTRSNKRGNIDRILQIFAYFGADKSILTDAHPHIGTDKLPSIINAMREKIISLGGEFHFDTKCTAFVTKENKASAQGNGASQSNAFLSVTGVRTENTHSGEVKEFSGDAVLLATGHSAVDIYALLASTNPQALEAKTFAVGVRVEHPRSLIDTIQYHGNIGSLPAAEYRLTSQQDGRGVYSFCMCPGGFVVPSATAPEQIVINGMSSAARNSKWSNSAIVVEVRPEDIPEPYVSHAKELKCPALAGLLWRTALEHDTYLHGGVSNTGAKVIVSQAAPAQLLVDFLAHKKSAKLPSTSYTPGVISSRLDEWLPKQLTTRLDAAFREFDKSMKGFVSEDALLIASETRTSTPVRILRNEDTFENVVLAHLYPAGEGSGYAGGIVSSAMDGENACEKILATFSK